MAEFTEFTATTPEVVPATEEKVYDKYWLTNLRIVAGDSTKPIRLMASWVPARDVTIQVPALDENGEAVLDENGEATTTEVTYKETKNKAEPKRLIIKDLLGEAEKNQNLAAAVETVLAALKAEAVSRDLL
jgi:hypothetical protein